MPVKGRSFGQERPPLTDLLKNILLRYPDGGQILKELVQNADDAGASEVKFLFDATSYGTSSLVSPELALFQGPALYCYNSAEFSDDDWEGIQRLMRSNKENNPLKVGRFGIGFNSVYHITDLPSIASGNTVAFLDPHEKYFVRGEPGRAFSTEDPLLHENFDQFEPFHLMFGCNLTQGNHYNGTLFRFPLRTHPSKLSNKIYTREMVNSLFDSLKSEASAILLFLKNIDSISLYEREQGGENVHLFTVKVSEESKIEIRKKRQELIENITVEMNFATRATFYLLKIEKQCPGKCAEKNEWFVASQIGTSEKKLIELARDLKLLPWIGIAFPLDVNNNMSMLGRIFCFLPLPPDGDCRTGLPVQVNGYFGLTDNRRALKWPGPDCQNDDTAEWNKLLLQKVGSQVYVNLIVNMVQHRSSNITQKMLATLVYSALPDLGNVRQDWRCILQPFFKVVLAREIFLTTPRELPRWINLGEAIINRLDESGEVRAEVKAVALNTLLSAGQPIVSLPGHALRVIDQFHQISGWKTLQKVTPELLCDVLRSNFDFNKLEMAFRDRLFVLEYALQCVPKNIANLYGVPLLPVENQEFIKFSSPSVGVEKIFIPSEKHSADLLPNMKHRLLYRKVSAQLEQQLNQLGSTGATQLFHPTANDIRQLLWQNLPGDWSSKCNINLEAVSWNRDTDGHPSLAWLELVWKWINENYPRNLVAFEGMPLIPVSINPPSSMARLRRNSTVIVSEHPLCYETLSNAVCVLLRRSGCIVVEKLPFFVRHDQLLNYIAMPTPSGILNVLSIAKEKVIQQLTVATNEVKHELCCILSRIDDITRDQYLLVCALPIFEAVDGKHFVSCKTERGNQRLVAPRNFSLPEGIQIVDTTNILASSKDESYRLLQKLGMRIHSTASLIVIHLNSFLSNSGISSCVKDNLMLWILERINFLNQEMPAFVEFVRQLACIPTAGGKRRAPSQLFDHSDGLLTRLLQGNDEAFPTKEFSEPIRRRKDQLKVRRREDLTAQDILVIVNRTLELRLDRCNALVELINQRPKLLKECTTDRRSLSAVLREVPWLPRMTACPTNYPDFMYWYDGMNLCEPKNMRPSSLAFLVGATVPLFDDRLIGSEVQEMLGISKAHVLKEAVEQLHLAIVSWTNQTTTPPKGIILNFEEMIKSIYVYLSQAPKQIMRLLFQCKSLTHWLWHGSGFTSPDKVALESPFPKNINLHPYLFYLPNELFRVKEFLLFFGVKPSFKVDDLLDMLSCIKSKHDNEDQPRQDAMQDLDQCRAVLEWIVKRADVLSEDLRRKLLIPVHTTTGRLQLEPCNTCTYCDREFLRKGVSEHAISTQSHLIHKAIPDDLANHLRVPRLSSCVAGAKAFGIKFKEAGQYEPLTTRLRNILQQYKEGVAIFKEIIQNADDAAASKVCFVVDWRENPRERLLTEELAKCQGPALWAYNDAMFSEKDFENIMKLAGETKKDDLNKVGRFGLGFNSVYHLTDVPSFLSGEHLVFFDPNMNHIAKLIDSVKRKGGVMLSLAESKDGLSLFPDQFLPYNQLFGCDMTGKKETFHFNGTLFRLPFRTAAQAQESDLSNEPYTKEHVCNLIKSLKESSSTLLLFAQNVNEVRVFEILKNSDPKTSLEQPIISITKSVEKVWCSNDADKIGEGTILQKSSAWLSNIRRSGMLEDTSQGPQRTELLNMNISMVKSDLSEVSEVFHTEETWLVNLCAGSRRSLQVALSDDGIKNGVVPVTGTAAKISLSNTHGVKILHVAGEVFCFMPLSFESGFPMHVNGYFSVYPNRRRLWEEGLGEHNAFKPFEAKWNEALMEDSLAQTYLQLLTILTSCDDKQYQFYSLWPNPTKVNYPKAWKPFLCSFYNKIIDEKWPLFHCNGNWRKLQDCLILDSKLNKIPDCVTIMNLLGGNVLSIPPDLMLGFMLSGKEAFINSYLLTEDRFLREFFFPKVSRIPNQLRNSVLVHILDRRLSKHRDYDDLLLTFPCFSCSKDGDLLRKPSELVHPKGKVACLFSEEEKRFPLDDRFLDKERAMMLEELGMVIHCLPWGAFCERGEWVSSHCDTKKAKLLVHYMNQMPEDCEITIQETKRLRAAQFLPILSKPKDCPFPWKGDECFKTQLAAADHLYPERHKYLVGSSQLILDESSPYSSSVPNRSLMKILGFSSKQPALPDVIAQLDLVIQLSNLLSKDMQETVCFTIYEFLQKVVTTEKSKQSYLYEQLQCRPWMLVKGQMVDPKCVALNWNKEDASPYLFTLPRVYRMRFEILVLWYGVQKNFSSQDFVKAVVKLREDTGHEKILENQIRTLITLLEEIFKLTNDVVAPLPLPSVNCYLHDANELVINNTPWLETDGTNQLVHRKIPVMLAYQCGAKDLRNADLTRCSKPIGRPFGQHENLTDRLKNILTAYPSDEGILKELLQNADDAKATEIHFVFDPRTHGSQHVFSDDWKDLQGPAICVYNNKPFSEEDIQGIQKLGIGSKVDDPAKTGQYGIGFNAVYHLTDCPYFISNDEVICVSDPHTAYVAGATETKPGRLYDDLNEMFRRNYQDVFSGFLGDLFDLKGSTMFRFPLRRNTAKLQSKISRARWNEKEVKKLFDLFRISAKKMMLFLNNVTKISVSEINPDGKLETYSATCEVSDIGKRAGLFENIRACSKITTEQIEWHEIHYVMKISGTNGVKEDWLVTQSLGCITAKESQIPNGTRMGLLPRAGIAARLPTTELHCSPFRHNLFCVLPLPVSINFPVHINGHFALDSARRGLWGDPKSSDNRVIWNDFMKRQVIAPAYALAIYHARMYILGYHPESNTSGTFPSKKETDSGLRWYHQLFPSIADLDEAWKPVGETLYKDFLSQLPVLPVAMSVPERKKPSSNVTCSSEPKPDADLTPVNVKWFKASEAFFCTPEMSWSLENTLLDIGFRLLSHAPRKIHESFKNAKCCVDVSPEQVRKFLRNHGIKDNLPQQVEDTVLHDFRKVYELTQYCKKAEDFYQNLEGLPLLLTQDDTLRCFSRNAVVFCSRFSQLLPARPNLFLHDNLRSFYSSKCSNVIREFLIPDLAKFQADLFPPAWINTLSHQPWNPSEQGTVPSKEWIKLVWEFIDTISKQSEDNPSEILTKIASWHIIPTTNNCLVPVSLGKTVLNVSSYLNSDSTQDKARRELLVKLGCPQLNHTILISSFSRSSNPGGATAVRKHYLAMIQSTEDVLQLLDQTLNGSKEIEATLRSHEIERLLVFLQSDLSRLSRSVLRKLPFYVTKCRTYTRLSDGKKVYELPTSVPADDLLILSLITNSIFLHEAPKLTDLYHYIGIKQASSVDFYTLVVLKHFNYLTPKGRENHLKYVRDHLLRYYYGGYEDILSALKQLSFIPDHSGVLRPAKEFYDPDNEVFKKFVPKEKFPPEPFDSMEWKEFLKKVGLQFILSQEHVLHYARQLEEEARDLLDPYSDKAKEILQKSGLLVSHLFENKGLHTSPFLSQISKIQFVPAAKIKKLYLDIHPSSTQSILTCFSGSVIATYTALVWSSASLVCNSAVPYSKGNLMNLLGIHSRPPYQLVVAHVKNISDRFPATKKQEVPSTLQTVLLDVMTGIYGYIKDSCHHKSGPPDNNCSSECKSISKALCNVPIILVDKHTLVRGNQLAVDGVWSSMEPYMFNIPRDLLHFDHFLQCLGAHERPTPLQLSLILKAIKESCGDYQMHPVEIPAAVAATRCLFLRLSREKEWSEKEIHIQHQRRGATFVNEAQSLANVPILFLPTESDYLKPSCKVFVNDTMEKKERLQDYWHELLIDLTMKDQEPPPKLVELLPSHLKVNKLSSKLNEELSPSCMEKICLLDQDPTTQSCEFIQRYRDIICSPEFSESLMRLYKFQEKTVKIPELVQNDVRSLENDVKVSCMQTIEVRLVTTTGNKAVADSESEVSTFCQRTPDGFCILIKHGGERNFGVLHEKLSSFISMITGQRISEANWRYLMMILCVKDPSEISKTLDEARIPRSISNVSREPNPGDNIPEHFHFLLKNDINYYLRDGELVGYEVREEDEENEAVYVFAKIIEQTYQGDGKFAFNSRYKIDIGKDKPIEVNKLKLYKFDRTGTKKRSNERTSSSYEAMTLVPYVGPEPETGSSRQDTNTRDSITLEEAKKEVAEALKEIWQLPESQRSSAIKRLIRQWHPDKNKGRESFANEVTQFLFNEVDRLKNGGSPGYRPDADDSNRRSSGPSRPGSTWDGPDFRTYFHSHGRRARRKRRCYDEWWDNYEGETEPASKDEANRWIRQAQKDLDAASYLFRCPEETHYSFTCFHCQQAVEKALKALMFAKGRLQRNDLEVHDVLSLAYRASELDPRLRAIPVMASKIHGYYIKTRYPDHRGGSFRDPIPSEMYTRTDADDALAKARQILQLLHQVLQ